MSFFTDILISIFAFIVALSILIVIHEAGHFIVARLCGVYVERFSLGFGPVLLSFHDKKKTEYSLSLLPFGGYVKMYGENNKSSNKDENVAASTNDERTENEAFCNKKVWQRFLIVAAGPLSNMFLAWLLYAAVFAVGIQDIRPAVSVIPNTPASAAGFLDHDLITSVDGTDVLDWEDALYNLLGHVHEDSVSVGVKTDLGKGADAVRHISLKNWNIDPEQHDVLGQIGLDVMSYTLSLKIEVVEKGSAADKSGFKVGDEFLELDGKKIDKWRDIVSYIKGRPAERIPVKVKRGNDIVDLILIPAEKKNPDGVIVGYAGIAPHVSDIPELRFERKYDFPEFLWKGAVKTWSISVVTVRTMWKLITGDISVKNISGPVGIAKGAGMTAQLGIVYFISFMALISVNLGILNLLPVPVLDGGHLFFYIIEAIRGKPLSDRVLNLLQMTGFCLLMLLMAVAIFNDVSFNL